MLSHPSFMQCLLPFKRTLGDREGESNTSRAMQPPCPRAGVVGCAASPISVDRPLPHVSPGVTTLHNTSPSLDPVSGQEAGKKTRAGLKACAALPISVDRLLPYVSPAVTTLHNTRTALRSCTRTMYLGGFAAAVSGCAALPISVDRTVARVLQGDTTLRMTCCNFSAAVSRHQNHRNLSPLSQLSLLCWQWYLCTTHTAFLALRITV